MMLKEFLKGGMSLKVCYCIAAIASSRAEWGLVCLIDALSNQQFFTAAILVVRKLSQDVKLYKSAKMLNRLKFIYIKIW